MVRPQAKANRCPHRRIGRLWIVDAADQEDVDRMGDGEGAERVVEMPRRTKREFTNEFKAEVVSLVQNLSGGAAGPLL